MQKPTKKERMKIMVYHEMVKFINTKYKIDIRRYQEFYSSLNDDFKKYMDFWHWVLDNCFYEVSNPCDSYWNMEEILNDEKTPNWIKEITQLFYNEFKDDLDEDGGIEVHISW